MVIFLPFPSKTPLKPIVRLPMGFHSVSSRDSYFKLTTDIDLEETEWKPIGNRTIGF
ncbi:MAG TPA: hypothetical protein GX527_08340, partial [Clostridiaceae bacterium]|nr:hypothetical protein [Clostridiaceae bacterium]